MAGRQLKLSELKVADLRRELEEREEEICGTKTVLQQRLRAALLKVGENPENYLFEGSSGHMDMNVLLNAIEDKLEQSARTIEERILENSRILKEELKEKTQSLEDKLLENVRNFEEFSETVERKFQSLDEIIKDNMGSKLEKQKGRIMEELMAQLQLPNLQRNTPSEIQGESRAVTRNPMKPPTFDGKTSWLTYIKQFEAAAVANAWSSSDRTTALILALRGDASDILQTLPPEELQDYSKLIKRLEMRYGHAHLEQVYHTQLKNRLQKKGENLQEFEADVARLVRLAYPTAPENFSEHLAIQTFVDGLRDSDTQQTLRLARPKTLIDALAHALEFEAAKQASRTNARVYAVNDQPRSEESMEEVIRRVIDKMQPKRRPLQCWNCGEVGHFRNNCRKMSRKIESDQKESEN